MQIDLFKLDKDDILEFIKATLSGNKTYYCEVEPEDEILESVSDVDTDDLISEINNRYLTKIDKAQIRGNVFGDFRDYWNGQDDSTKVDKFYENFDKFSLQDFEDFLKSKNII